MTFLAGKVKAGVITQEMQRKYAKQIRRAKLEEFKKLFGQWCHPLPG